MYHVFTRTWWIDNPAWPNGLEPHMGRKTTLARTEDFAEAREIADQYNTTHDPGRLSRKAEIQSE